MSSPAEQQAPISTASGAESSPSVATEQKARPQSKKGATAQSNNISSGSSKGKKAGGDSTSSSSSAPKAEKPTATHIAMHFALATRFPVEKGGGIIAIAAVAFNPETQTIVETFERNVLPVDPANLNPASPSPSATAPTTTVCAPAAAVAAASSASAPANSAPAAIPADCTFPQLMSADTRGYWGGSDKRADYLAITRNQVHPRAMMQDLFEFVARTTGKRCTLVFNPLGNFFSMLLFYQSLYLTAAQSPPWGFGALCCRSFCAGVLGCGGLGQVQTHPKVLEWCEGFDGAQTAQPIAAAVACAVQFCNATRFVLLSGTASTASPVAAGGAKKDDDDENRRAETVSFSKVTWKCNIPSASAVGYTVPLPLPELRYIPLPETAENDTNKNQRNSSSSSSSSSNLALLLYPSITDADFGVKKVEAAAEEFHLSAADWVVQEKVHGGNLGVALDVEGNIYASRRETPLARADSSAFFSFDYLIEEMKIDLKALLQSAVNKFGGGAASSSSSSSSSSSTATFKMLQLFGEIAGGDYDDKRVPPEIGYARVQRGVYYTMKHMFYVFDAVVHFQQQDQQQQHQPQQLSRFLGFDELSDLFNSIQRHNTHLLLAVPLARGKFADLLNNTPVEFSSTIPSLLNLPARAMHHPHQQQQQKQHSSNGTNANRLDGEKDSSSSSKATVTQQLGPNWAEGWVLRPVVEATGTQLLPLSALAQAKRPLVKRKHPLFREFVGGGGSDQLFADVPLSQIPLRFVTLARVASVVSKMTKGEREDAAKVAAATVADINKDFAETLKARIAAESFKMSAEDVKNLEQQVAAAVKSFLS